MTMKKKNDLWVQSTRSFRKFFLKLKIVLIISIVFIPITMPSFADVAFEKELISALAEGDLQQRQITGTVTDGEGNPLPGVSVIIKGSTLGTLTDAAGKYILPNVPQNSILVFSFIGMTTQEIPAEGKASINAVLSEDVVGLDEVIVIGYGTAKKSDLTGSVSRVEAESIKKQATTQVVETLSGTVAGLYSNQDASASGGASLELRGPSSLAAKTDPLIVLDGVIYPGSLREINPGDILSVDVLRDASSAAIFGSRAAGGVILITTQKGRQGKPTINFSSKVGVASTTNDFYPYGLDPDGDPMDYFNMRRDLLYENSKGVKQYYYYWNPDDLPNDVSVEQWRNYSPNPLADPLQEWFQRIDHFPIEEENFKKGRTTNFYDEVIGSGLRQDYSLSVGGGSENAKYYMSIGYLNNEGIIKGDEFSAVRTRLNLDFKVTDWLNLGTNTQFSYRDESVVQASLSMLARMSPYGVMYNDDGSPVMYPHEHPSSRNPLENYLGQDRLRDINSLFSVLYADVKLPFGITYRISYQPNFSFTKDFNFWSSDTFTGMSTYKNGYGTRDLTNAYGWQLDNLLKWNKTFGAHNFDITLLANAERNKSWTTEQYNSEFAPNQNLGFGALQFGAKPGLENSDLVSSGDALMARLNYTLLDRYLFTASFRRDGYSAFGQKNPRATFPAFALAWKIDSESFYNVSWMERLKLRFSWGENGNREIGAYSALAQMGAVINLNSAGNVETGVYNTRLANPNLVWERTASFNVGLDIGLFKNRIDMTIDAYDAETHDLLLNRQLPRITGFSSITSNLGVLGNQGIEATIRTVNYTRPNLSWRTTVVFSLNRNKIEELWGDFGNFKILNKDQYGELPDFQNQWFPGYARDIIWDYNRIGIWQLDEAENAVSFGLVPGDYKASDVNQDGDYTQFEDKKFIGYTEPRHRWGITNDFDIYKNFSLSFFIRADLGHLRSVPNLGNRSEFNRYNDWAWGYWSPENPDSKFQRNTYPDNLSQFEGSIRVFEPAGFLRLQDLSLSYNVDMTKLRRILPLQSLRILFTGRNVITMTKWPGFDPEASGTTPMPKTFTFGIDISL